MAAPSLFLPQAKGKTRTQQRLGRSFLFSFFFRTSFRLLHPCTKKQFLTEQFLVREKESSKRTDEKASWDVVGKLGHNGCFGSLPVTFPALKVVQVADNGALFILAILRFFSAACC